MIKRQIIIASPHGNLQEIKALLKDRQSKEWVYFGKDYLALANLELALNDGYTFIDTAELHSKVADSIKAEYVGWIDELNKKYGQDIDWWFGTVFSRNNYHSELFQYACYSQMLSRLLADKNILPALVFVESEGLAKDLRDWARKNNIDVLIKSKSFGPVQLLRCWNPLLDWFKFIIISIMRNFVVFISKVRCQGNKTFPQNVVLIHTFVHGNSLSKEGVFNDRYLPFLHDYISRNGLKIVVHPVIYGFKYPNLSIYTRMRNSSTPFIIKEDFLKLSDYLYVLTYPIRALKRKIGIKDFKSFNFSNSVKEMRARECFSSSMEAALIYRLFHRLKQSGFKPGYFIVWFENQIMDKALIAGARESFPEIKITGAQMFLHPPNLLSLFPAQSEVDARIAPDVLIETSAYQCKRATVFTEAIPCKVGAGLRYAHVFKERAAQKFNAAAEPVILFVLPFSLSESIEILLLLKKSLSYIKHKISIFVKAHPDCSIEKIKEKLGGAVWPKEFQVVGGSLADILNRTSIMISANSSSMVEAVSYGIPVIYSGSRIMINQNILKDADSEMVRECYAALDLADAINTYIQRYSEKTEEYKKAGIKMRDRYFTPVSDETLAVFLEGKGGN